MFKNIYITESVFNEIFVKQRIETKIIEKNIGSFIKKIKVKKTLDSQLGLGERESISLCLQNKIKNFLSDDKKARRLAQSLNIKTIGILGVLLYNFKENKITKIQARSYLNKLIENDFYISTELYSKILSLLE